VRAAFLLGDGVGENPHSPHILCVPKPRSFFEKVYSGVARPVGEFDLLGAEIDKLVYALYGLTAEEIRIVEGTWLKMKDEE
jgi:hypothetical protein